MHPEGNGSEAEVGALYLALLEAWNRRRALNFGALFADRGSMVGFDGSQANGAREISAHLTPIFASHPTPSYIGVIQETRVIAPGIALVRAVAGLVPPGEEDIVPALNAIQTLVAARHGALWRAEMFHNTPAQFHSRPELAEQLTATLREALRNSQRAGL